MSADRRAYQLPAAVCAVAGDVVSGSHPSLDELFRNAGAPGDPPDLAHHSKWKEWLRRAGRDPEVDGLSVLGYVIEEFMDLPPIESGLESFYGGPTEIESYQQKRNRLIEVFRQFGLEYFPGGRIIRAGDELPATYSLERPTGATAFPDEIRVMLKVLLSRVSHASSPLTQRRKGLTPLSMNCEYDFQDVVHALLRTWVADIRPEEFSPSYAGKSGRSDFLLPRYQTIVEVKYVRDMRHARSVRDELIVDIDHYAVHPQCSELWCAVYDPQQLIANPEGFESDLAGNRTIAGKSIEVRVIVVR